MKRLRRAALAAFVAAPLLMPIAVLADTGSNSLAASAGTFYVTQIGEGALARVVVGSDGSVKVDSNYISGLSTEGPDSAVFAADGTLLTSNFGAGSISRVDVGAQKVLTQQVNKVLIPTIADLAFDPSSNSVWGIVFGGSGPTAISRVDLGNGNISPMNTANLTDLGGIAITETGSRIFVSSHTGDIAEIDKNGHQVRKLTVQGSPDGMSYDPSSGYLFAAGCNGICEIDTGGAGGSKLTLLKTFDAVDGDGIAADGSGHVYVAKSTTCGTLCRLDLSTGKVVTITDAIPAADDVVPLTGAGAGGTCKTLGSCFDGAAAAGLAAAGVGLVVFMGAAGFGGPRPTPLPTSSTARADVAQGTTAAHAGAATAHGTAASHLATGPAAAHPHPPPPPPTATLETTHLQEEAGDKLLEAGGAGLEHGVEAEAGAGGAGGLGGATRIGRDEKDARDQQPEPSPPPPQELLLPPPPPPPEQLPPPPPPAPHPPPPPPPDDPPRA